MLGARGADRVAEASLKHDIRGKTWGGRGQSRGIGRSLVLVERTVAGGLGGWGQQKDLASLWVSWDHSEGFGGDKHDLTDVHQEQTG